jgi:hypothetical protein
LAVDIADTVSRASEKQSPVDVEAKAQELLDEHPEADATRSDIADTLRDESKMLAWKRGRPAWARLERQRRRRSG